MILFVMKSKFYFVYQLSYEYHKFFSQRCENFDFYKLYLIFLIIFEVQVLFGNPRLLDFQIYLIKFKY